MSSFDFSYGRGQPLNTAVSPGGKGGGQSNPAVSPGGKGGGQSNPMANDPFINTYMGGGKGGYTQPQQPSYQSSYIDPYSQPFRQSPINNPYAGAFPSFTGSYGYQQPTYYQPPQQSYSPPQQFYSPQQQYFSPYMNQFQMAGSQFYQQPYSYQPQSSFYQPRSQMGGRSQLFSQMTNNGLLAASNFSNPNYTPDYQALEQIKVAQQGNSVTDPETGRSFVIGGPMQTDWETGQAYRRAMESAGISQPPVQTIGGKGG